MKRTIFKTNSNAKSAKVNIKQQPLSYGTRYYETDIFDEIDKARSEELNRLIELNGGFCTETEQDKIKQWNESKKDRTLLD